MRLHLFYTQTCADLEKSKFRKQQKHIESFPITKITSDFVDRAEGNEGLCQVCQCEYEEGEEMKTLPCKHHFHPECIDQWLKDHPTCCICKRSVLDASEEKSNLESHEINDDVKLSAEINEIQSPNRLVRSPSA